MGGGGASTTGSGFSGFSGELLCSGVDSNFCGVFSKSASVPSSVSSSRHRTPRLDGVDFFLTGVKEIPLRAPAAALRLRGEDFNGEANTCWSAVDMAASAGGAATGFALMILEDFFRFGVPRLDGGKISAGIRDPSGLMHCEAAE